MFKIGDFSKLTMVSIRMLRYYDEMGLFKPAKIDAFTGYRYYSAKQITKLNLIVSLRDIGFNVSDISIAINEQSDEKLKEMLEQKEMEIKNNIKAEEEKLRKINAKIENLEKERVNMNYNVTLKSIPSYKVISLRDTVPTYQLEGILWQKLGEYIQNKKIFCNNMAYATYHDEDYKEGPADIEISVVVEKLLNNADGFTFKETTPIDQVVSILVPGEYSNISPAYNYIGEWIEENGYDICGSARALPLKGSCNEANPNDYLTELQVPVKKII
ncbi:MerR family transcriptional regulator [Clostridium tyrobutyricum]|uniref:Transcriptional regulator, MerR family n=1 Tax=Clostridium tyrobutyricum DIVETGP TaxID=1408889 RepID=W6N6N1_CLOTY|nr:MerR family transcriptional regulator [Clostridium tyrobutyricum]AND83621.1 MerR family HTH transcriptional regulator [Clostridium tyrobutyricum]ANP68394.1 MerR family transcriptional regulator [Clostridium tyrobutyricum]MBV4435622.1 MerR family transcriptional regulator [Clostridium tyrobutyricum]QNB67259.1 MerR family transcriptional regulator [Clostridium tyrobutyricum]CDL92056.1 Transcriptional regulator, MerR family [Clostridium tyrobutyricum DIVETGP]